MSVGGVEAGNAPVQVIVGAARSGYPRDKIGECSRLGVGGNGNRRIG